MRTARLLTLVLLVAPPGAAQSGAAVLDGWRADTRRALEGVESVTLTEARVRTIDGPRGPVEIETRARLTMDAAGRLHRRVLDARRGGRPTDDVGRIDGRLRRGFGRAAVVIQRPPLLPLRLLDGAAADGRTDERVGRQRAWRVDLRWSDRPDRGAAWFTRSARSPQLLRLRIEGPQPHGGTSSFAADYARTDGLDLPVRSEVEVQVRQRRRLRTYAVTLRGEATYRDPAVRRR